MTKGECAPANRPGSNAIAVMNLGQRYARLLNDAAHLDSVSHSDFRISIQWFDQDAATRMTSWPLCELASVFNAEKARLYADATRHQVLAKFYDPRFALIGGNEVRHCRPRLDGSVPASWVGDDRR
jgi:hypothetical protein